MTKVVTGRKREIISVCRTIYIYTQGKCTSCSLLHFCLTFKAPIIKVVKDKFGDIFSGFLWNSFTCHFRLHITCYTYFSPLSKKK